ncbi:TIGR02450 family Trp-rich protein [Methylophaga sp.]|uniref:TIGR02450 family Trp-rich protein n=1 Tax=Methylophaga sp. TaxID=2024840 RepID=UPI003F696AD3
MNQINPEKLMQSKWTATKLVRKEKHFMVTEVDRDAKGVVTHCYLEAVLTKKVYHIRWEALKEDENWLLGWH